MGAPTSRARSSHFEGGTPLAIMSSSPVRLTLLAALALLFVGLCAWWLTTKSPTEAGFTLTPNEIQDVAAERRQVELALDPQTVAPARREATAKAADDSVSADDQQATPLGSAVGLSGTLVIVEPDGSRNVKASGKLEVFLWGRNGRTRLAGSVEVTDGQWEYLVPRSPDGRLRLSMAGFGDGNALFDENAPEEWEFSIHVSGVEGDAPAVSRSLESSTARGRRYAVGTTGIEHVIHRLGGVTLSVLDEHTGQHLDGLTVLRSRVLGSGASAHPAGQDVEILQTDAASPVRLTAENGSSSTRRYLLKSDGYAWTPIELELFGESERTVRLGRGASLKVEFPPFDVRGCMVRIRQENMLRLVSEWPVAEGSPMQWDGLEPGTYQVQMEKGTWYSNPRVFASERVDLIADAAHHVQLAPALPEPASYARAAGVLVLPADWGEAPSATFRALGEGSGVIPAVHLTPDRFRKQSGTLDVYEFEVGRMQTGPWLFELHKPRQQFRFKLERVGRRDLRFEVGDPVDMTVRVVDSQSGAPIDVDHLFWSVPRPEGVVGGRAERVDRKAGESSFEVRVPEGPVTFATADVGYLNSPATVDAVRGLQATLELEPAPTDQMRMIVR